MSVSSLSVSCMSFPRITSRHRLRFQSRSRLQFLSGVGDFSSGTMGILLTCSPMISKQRQDCRDLYREQVTAVCDSCPLTAQAKQSSYVVRYCRHTQQGWDGCRETCRSFKQRLVTSRFKSRGRGAPNDLADTRRHNRTRLPSTALRGPTPAERAP